MRSRGARRVAIAGALLLGAGCFEAAAGLAPDGDKRLDGVDMSAVIFDAAAGQRERPLYFASEIPTFGSFQFAVIDGRWKLVEFVERDWLSTSVTRQLFRIDADPHELNNVAEAHPNVVERLAKLLHDRRMLHPVGGIRGRIASPPGWHPPQDWATYPRPMEGLQADPASSMAPTPLIERALDYNHGERGRIIYDCEPVLGMGGACRP